MKISPEKYRTDFFFTIPSFLIGMGNVFNIAGNYFPFSYSDDHDNADARAIESDWQIVGDDIRNATSEIDTALSHIED